MPRIPALVIAVCIRVGILVVSRLPPVTSPVVAIIAIVSIAAPFFSFFPKSQGSHASADVLRDALAASLRPTPILVTISRRGAAAMARARP